MLPALMHLVEILFSNFFFRFLSKKLDALMVLFTIQFHLEVQEEITLNVKRNFDKPNVFGVLFSTFTNRKIFAISKSSITTIRFFPNGIIKN